jgi:hypothetical protein
MIEELPAPVYQVDLAPAAERQCGQTVVKRVGAAFFKVVEAGDDAAELAGRPDNGNGDGCMHSRIRRLLRRQG